MSKFHSILFLLESKKKNHCAKALYVATVQKYDAVFGTVLWTASLLSVRFFSWGPSRECDHYLVLKTKSKEESWIVVVPSCFKWLLQDTSVPYLVKRHKASVDL